MKHPLLLLMLGFSLLGSAQNKINFTYDNAGNQIQRSLCMNCPGETSKQGKDKIKDVEALEEKDLQKFFPEDELSYYPNPVKEELYLKWSLPNNSTITSLELYSLNGQLLQSFKGTEKITSQTIPFQSYSAGIYLIVLNYSNGEQKTIKISKQ